MLTTVLATTIAMAMGVERNVVATSGRVLALLLATAPTAYAQNCVLHDGQCSGENFNGGVKKCCGASPCPRKTAP